MGTPSQPLEIIHPNGHTVLYLNPYSGTYTASRSYGLRMQRGYARGLPQTRARGKPINEAAIRRRQERLTQGETRWSRYQASFKRRYGFDYSYWRYLRRRWIDEINRLTSKDGFGYITIESVAQLVQNWNLGWRDPNFPEFDSWQAWIEMALTERLNNMIEYQEYRNPIPGRTRWNSRDSTVPIEFYFYH